MPGRLRKTAEWLDWEVDIGYHASERSVERHFNETDLRAMISDMAGFEPSHVEGRFVLYSRLRDEEWRVVVEPDHDERKLYVVTAWRV